MTSDKPKTSSTNKPKNADKPKGGSVADKPSSSAASVTKGKPSADKPKLAADKPAARPKDAREALIASAREQQAAAPDPLAALEPKKLATRVGIPLAIVWVIAFILNGWIPKVVALVV